MSELETYVYSTASIVNKYINDIDTISVRLLLVDYNISVHDNKPFNPVTTQVQLLFNE